MNLFEEYKNKPFNHEIDFELVASTVAKLLINEKTHLPNKEEMRGQINYFINTLAWTFNAVLKNYEEYKYLEKIKYNFLDKNPDFFFMSYCKPLLIKKQLVYLLIRYNKEKENNNSLLLEEHMYDLEEKLKEAFWDLYIKLKGEENDKR